MSDSDRKYNVAIVGLSFGAEFIPIYQAYPYTQPARRSASAAGDKLDAVGDTWGVEKRYTRLRRAAQGPRRRGRSTSTRLHRTTPTCASPASRRASTWPAPSRWR